MTPEDWKIVKQAFNEAVELPVTERDAFLEAKFNGQSDLRAEVEKMLAADEASDQDDTLEENAYTVLSEKSLTEHPERIGHYKIIREIGRGGMGAVFEALRETPDFKQKVALKIIKRGMDTDAILSRFHHERQILASLQHQNIAGFIDGGMTEDGLPFYAMEYIEGTDIETYCRREGLTIDERLEIFLKVCEAVQYAHQNFIAHRDLKPNNILITNDKTVKLLDFGIAKVLSSDGGLNEKTGTVTEFRMMTPAYASPEQVRGEKVGVQSDIYSLGVILYELLTGRKPFDFKNLRPDEAVKMICESDPLKPSAVKTALYKADDPTNPADLSTVGSLETTIKNENPKSEIPNPKSLRGDLDNIILKSLQKMPERRYASVEQFAEDLRRYLKGLPVSARPDTFSYRASKFLKRHRAAAVAGSLIFAALVAGLIATLYQTSVAQAERLRAEKRFAEVRKLANNVVFKYHDAIADLPGSTEAREMLVKDATEYLDNLARDAEDNPELQHELARAYMKIGNVQGSVYTANLGNSEESLKSYEKSIRIFESLLKTYPENVEYLKTYIQALDQKTLLAVRLYRWREAERTGEKMLAAARRLSGIEPSNVEHRTVLARSFQTMGDAVKFSRGYPEAIEWFERARAASEDLLTAKPGDETITRNLVVPVQRIGTTSEYQAEILKETGAPAEEIEKLYERAERMHLRSYEIARELKRRFPEKQMYDRYIGAIGINYGTALARNGKGTEGIPLIETACANFRKTAAGDPKNSEAKRDISECLQYLAFARDAAGNSAGAIEANRESIRILEEITVKDPTNFEFLAQAHLTFNNTGDIFMKEGKLGEALSFYKRGIEYVEKMSKLNDSSQIKLLRSDSNRKIGDAYLAIAAENKDPQSAAAAREHLEKALKDLRELQKTEELGKINEHKIGLIERKLK
jgi:eukaryotic-like serine/threonine-protein kinase